MVVVECAYRSHVHQALSQLIAQETHEFFRDEDDILAMILLSRAFNDEEANHV